MQIKTDVYKEKAVELAQRMGDFRFVVQVIFAVLALLVTWSGVKSIQTNYNLQKQISALKQQNNIQKLENTNLSLQNQYFNSDQYLELAARQNFGVAVPGEKEVIVPQSVAMAYTINLPTSNQDIVVTPPQAVYQKNFQSWVNFFLHRQANN